MELVFSGNQRGSCAVTHFVNSNSSSDQIIRMAWEDRTTFEEIEAKTGFPEKEVIKIMRRELKPSGFRLWRKRVSGRITKHRKRFESEVKSKRGRVSFDLE